MQLQDTFQCFPQANGVLGKLFLPIKTPQTLKRITLLFSINAKMCLFSVAGHYRINAFYNKHISVIQNAFWQHKKVFIICRRKAFIMRFYLNTQFSLCTSPNMTNIAQLIIMNNLCDSKDHTRHRNLSVFTSSINR